MSRPFWIVIGAIVGFVAGGFAGIGLARATFSCCYGETMFPFAGSIAGVVVGVVTAWQFAGRRRSSVR